MYGIDETNKHVWDLKRCDGFLKSTRAFKYIVANKFNFHHNSLFSLNHELAMGKCHIYTHEWTDEVKLTIVL